MICAGPSLRLQSLPIYRRQHPSYTQLAHQNRYLTQRSKDQNIKYLLKIKTFTGDNTLQLHTARPLESLLEIKRSKYKIDFRAQNIYRRQHHSFSPHLPQIIGIIRAEMQKQFEFKRLHGQNFSTIHGKIPVNT